MGYIKAGKVIGSQGINGELQVELFAELSSNTKYLYIDLGNEDFTIDGGDSKVAYNVDGLRMKDDNIALIRFMEIGGRSQASFMEGKTLYLKRDTYDEIKDAPTKKLEKLLGYLIYDFKERKQLGTIVDIKRVKRRDSDCKLIIIESDKQKIPIPYEEDVIKMIDHKNKSVYIKMPYEFLEVLLTDKGL